MSEHNKFMLIKVRKSIRILGLILSILGFFAVIDLIISDEKLRGFDIYFITIGGIFFFPLVLSSSILGHVPLFISNRIPKSLEDTTLNAEKNFKEFSVESVTGAIVFFVIVFLTIYFQKNS
tara:strand:+ start:6224 stop:6586 length:363 start_codon:yes stop_codon:yes gene_type:complete